MDNLLGRSTFLGETGSLFSNEKISASRSKVIDALNETVTAGAQKKCEIIATVQELILHTAIELLDEFLENVLSFSQDVNQDVRKNVAGFIEEVCKVQISQLPNVVSVLFLLLRDKTPVVIKRVIQGCAAIYRNSIQWICSLGDITEEVEQAWNTLCLIKAQILDMIDNDNDGIRTNAIKFLEGIVILQTYPDDDSMKRDNNDFSLNDIPLTLKIARRRKLEDEARNIFDLLLQFHGASHISSVNLIACTGTLCIIAKMRPSMMNQVIEALTKLHSNLPPTLTNSQVNSVRKNLKMQFINILKHPASFEHQTNIAQILQDLGASNSEIARAIPKIDKKEQQRRAKRALENATQMAAKKAKVDAKKDKVQVPRQMEIDIEELAEQQAKAVKINESFLSEHLQKIETVTQLVIMGMSKLPNEVPKEFLQNYTPVTNISMVQQIQKIAQLLGHQMMESKVGPGMSAISKDPPMKMKIPDEEEKSIIFSLRKERKDDEEQENDEEVSRMEVDVNQPVATTDEEKKKIEATRKLRETLERVKGQEQGEPKMKQRLKTLKLQEITKPLSRNIKEQILTDAIKRILKSDKQALVGGISFKRKRIITIIGSTFMPAVQDVILEFILEDIVKRVELAFSWIFEEYSLFQGFTRHTYVKSEHKPDYAYSQLFMRLIKNIMDRTEFREKESLLKRFYLEAPMIPDDAIKLLVQMCDLEELSDCGLQIAKDLLIRRPPKEEEYLRILLKYTFYENVIIREKALEYLINVYSMHQIQQKEIAKHARKWLKFMEKDIPPEEVFLVDFGRSEMTRAWTEDLSKLCFTLYMEVLPYDQSLLMEITNVYTKISSPDIKRIILRAIEAPIRRIGNSEEMLKLVELCPKGSETLITRIIYILTEKSIPSTELVEKVRTLHQTKVSDVRLLIPVINGLSKNEILAALPKLIKLTPVVVKELFNRLLGIGSDYDNAMLPLSSVELLVALHTMDPSKVELKWCLKAVSLCLAEKDVYTHEVLAIVMQQLVEISPIPTLLMRTVIQSLSLHPRLSGFVINLLQRLILKQVWRNKVVWEGFIKCCQRLRPQSLGIMIQLPAQQLQDSLEICPDFREPMLEYAKEIMEHQIGHVSQPVMDVLLGISQFNNIPNNDLQVVTNYADNPIIPSASQIVVKQERKPDITTIKLEKDATEPAPPGME